MINFELSTTFMIQFINIFFKQTAFSWYVAVNYKMDYIK